MSSGFTEQDVGDQSGKTVLITGSNTGLGYETARVLAARGARVLVACRSEQKGRDAMARIQDAHPAAELEYTPLDLADLASVHACAKLVQAEDKLDVLINNAGIMMPPFGLTKDGFESQFGVNHLGPFALTALLLDKVRAAPAGRVVNTSSIAHRNGKIIFDDINAENGYRAATRYSMSKLANLLFNYELQRRLEAAGDDILAVACHPGIADTELSRYFPGYLRALLPVMRPLFNSAAQGAWPTLLAATGEDVSSGDYLGPAKRNQTAGPAVTVRSNRRSHDRELARRLWDLSIEMTGIDPGI